MRIILVTKNGEKYTWKPTAWQKALGYTVLGLLGIANIYLLAMWGYANGTW